MWVDSVSPIESSFLSIILYANVLSIYVLDAMYASFMKNILGAIDPNELQSLLVNVQQKTLNSSSGLGSESSGNVLSSLKH